MADKGRGGPRPRAESGPEKSPKELVAELEERIEKLRVAFEKYFLGIDKRPPFDQRDQVVRIIRHLQGKRIAQPVVRFQFQGLVGRFNVFDTYWTRILRQIEEGTYQRDLFKARLREPQQRPPGAENASPPPAGDLGWGLREEELRKVYDEYIEARRFCGEPTEGLSYEKVRAALLREAPRIAEKARVDRVSFEVVLRQGKAVLKGLPGKGI